jgi:alpha-tubulin suppressor-like RCC1 family protein
VTSIGNDAFNMLDGDAYLLRPVHEDISFDDFPSTANIYACDGLDEENNPVNCQWLDFDKDYIHDIRDDDDDNDGVIDQIDGFPLDATLNADVDSDGLPDDYEDYYELDKYNFTDAVSDNDNDGLTATEEFLLGTFPNNNDSDSDTLLDHWELETNLDPLVPDYQIGLGMYFSCALADLGIECWGTNALGQIDVPDLNNPTQITVGNFASCAIDNTEPVCWGHNMQGQINLPELTNPTQISIGGYHSCAIDHSEVICWGQSIYGKTNVPALSNPTQISAGDQHTCAIDDSGVVCWGNNEYALIDVPSITNPTHISSGLHHACAIDDSGVVCWGDNSYNQTTVPELINPMQISLGNYHSCVIDDTGVVCWGSNDENQINVPELINPKQISLGGIHSCALDDTGVVCWGSNDHGQIEVPNLVFDIDGDNVNNYIDKFPLDTNEAIDFDNDGIGDNADSDDDNDGVSDDQDLYPLDDRYALDTDSDGIPDNWEMLYGLDPNDQTDSASDQDGDGAVALQEFFEGTIPVVDSDDDGFADHIDLFPQDPTESTDTDEDGIGDNQDNCPLVDNVLQLDMDEDGIGNACDEDIYDNEVFRYKVLGDGAQIVGCSGTCLSDLIIPDSIDGHVVTSIGAEAFRGAGIASLDLPDSIVDIKYAAFMVNALTKVEIPSSVAEIGHEAFSSNQITSLSIPGNVAWIYSGAFKHNQLINLDLHDGIRFIGNTAFWDNNLTLTKVPQSVVQIQESAFADNNLASVIFEGNRPEIYENSFAGNQLIHIYYCSDEDWSNDSVQNLTPERYDGCDRDNDGYIDGIDAFPQNPSEWLDTDQDGIGDNEDTDADNDGFLNTQDAFPLIASEQYDFDMDGIGDNADADDDNDNVLDSIDLFPLDAFESADSDDDGVGDNADFFPNSAEYSLDSDLDQMPDAWERKYGLNPTDASDALIDQDNDGLTALEEYEAGTIPLKILDIDANGSFDALTDGLIILRYAFGLRGENLVRSATAGDAMRTDAADVEAYLNSLVPGL